MAKKAKSTEQPVTNPDAYQAPEGNTEAPQDPSLPDSYFTASIIDPDGYAAPDENEPADTKKGEPDA